MITFQIYGTLQNKSIGMGFYVVANNREEALAVIVDLYPDFEETRHNVLDVPGSDTRPHIVHAYQMDPAHVANFQKMMKETGESAHQSLKEKFEIHKDSPFLAELFKERIEYWEEKYPELKGK